MRVFSKRSCLLLYNQILLSRSFQIAIHYEEGERKIKYFYTNMLLKQSVYDDDDDDDSEFSKHSNLSFQPMML